MPSAAFIAYMIASTAHLFKSNRYAGMNREKCLFQDADYASYMHCYYALFGHRTDIQ